MRRWAIGCASVAVLAVLAVVVMVGLYILDECSSGKVTVWNYEKVRMGMTVKEAEAILGPGQETPIEYVLGTRDGPVVSGEKAFVWAKDIVRPMDSKAVWVGVRNGRICSKWYWEPSL